MTSTLEQKIAGSLFVAVRGCSFLGLLSLLFLFILFLFLFRLLFFGFSLSYSLGSLFLAWTKRFLFLLASFGVSLLLLGVGSILFLAFDRTSLTGTLLGSIIWSWYLDTNFLCDVVYGCGSCVITEEQLPGLRGTVSHATILVQLTLFLEVSLLF